jgi:hypothetical protein
MVGAAFAVGEQQRAPWEGARASIDAPGAELDAFSPHTEEKASSGGV